jgi:hypothetical protein
MHNAQTAYNIMLTTEIINLDVCAYFTVYFVFFGTWITNCFHDESTSINIMTLINILGLFFRTGKIFFGLTRFSCLSVRMTDNFSASFGKSDNAQKTSDWTNSSRAIRDLKSRYLGFTLVLAIGHLISPLVFIEVKVIQFSVFSVVQYCICYVFYSVCLEFCCKKMVGQTQSPWVRQNSSSCLTQCQTEKKSFCQLCNTECLV